MIPVDPAKPYTLKAIFESVMDSMDVKMTGLSLQPAARGFGARALARNESAPRIVAIPTTGRVTGMLGRGGDGTTRAWSLWGRNVTCEFHIWGKDEEGTEILANHFVASLHDLRAGLYAFESETWEPSADGDLGQVVILTATIYTIWSRELIPYVTNPTQVISGGIVPPS